MLRHIGLCMLVIPVLALAHPGRTNSSGCHNDRKHGGYHCHGGAPAISDSPSGGVPLERATTPAPRIPFLGERLPDGGVYDPYAVPGKKELATETLPAVPVDARPIRAPVDKATAPKTSAPSPPEPQAPKAAPVERTRGDPVLGCVCLFFMGSGIVWLAWVARKALRKRVARGEVSTPEQEGPPERQGPHEIIRNEKKTKRMFEKEMRAYRYSACSVCTIRIRPDDQIFWDPYDKQARHAGYCEQLVSEANAKAAKKAERDEQVARSEAFHRLLERLTRAKTAATREKVVTEAKAETALTAQQRLRLLLDASKADTDDTLEKVETLKSKAVKRRRLEEMLSAIKADEVPDELQADQIALLEEALRTLDAEA